jgi:hypothetical protein
MAARVMDVRHLEGWHDMTGVQSWGRRVRMSDKSSAGLSRVLHAGSPSATEP